jgi:hypothetical protein
LENSQILTGMSLALNKITFWMKNNQPNENWVPKQKKTGQIFFVQPLVHGGVLAMPENKGCAAPRGGQFTDAIECT